MHEADQGSRLAVGPSFGHFQRRRSQLGQPRSQLLDLGDAPDLKDHASPDFEVVFDGGQEVAHAVQAVGPAVDGGERVLGV